MRRSTIDWCGGRSLTRIDRRAIIDGAMFGYGTPIGSHFPPHSPDYVDLTGVYPHDVAQARSLLAQAGYPKGFSLTLKLPPPSYARRAGEIIASELAEVGIRVQHRKSRVGAVAGSGVHAP